MCDPSQSFLCATRDGGVEEEEEEEELDGASPSQTLSEQQQQQRFIREQAASREPLPRDPVPCARVSVCPFVSPSQTLGVSLGR